MRIVSLLPSATEILFALGVGKQVVGVTHECDFPPAARSLPAVTRDLLPPGLSAAEIDTAVAAGIRDEHTIYALDAERLAALEPDVVVTQDLCDVCAVTSATVTSVACTLPAPARVVAADPHDLHELPVALRGIAAAVGAEAAGEEWAASFDDRLAAVAEAVSDRPQQSVLVLEWPDPPWAPGHWVPSMIAAAGGACVLGMAGEPSRRTTWEALDALDVDVVVTAFCGFDLEQSLAQLSRLEGHAQWQALCARADVWVADGSAYFSRPGPRLVDGVELLAGVLHPDAWPAPPASAARAISSDHADGPRLALSREVDPRRL